MDNKIVRVKMPPALVAKLDTFAKQEYASRSEFIRQAIIEKIRSIEHPRFVTRELPSGIRELEDLYNEVRLAYGRAYTLDQQRALRREHR